MDPYAMSRGLEDYPYVGGDAGNQAMFDANRAIEPWLYMKLFNPH